MSWSLKTRGVATYTISERYQVAGGSPTEYATLVQQFEIFDDKGSAQVRKAGEKSAIRTP